MFGNVRSLRWSFVGVLSDLNRGGWKLIALPHVLEMTWVALEDHTTNALELLTALQGEAPLQC